MLLKKIRFWAIRNKLMDPKQNITDNVTREEVIKMLYKLFVFDKDQGKTEIYKEVK